METVDIISQAIRERKSISFEYNKEDKVRGQRVGDPYAVFNFTPKTGESSIKVHIVQTDGVSDSETEHPFPDFRQFNIEDIDNIQILDSTFIPNHPKYNSDWEGYANVIEKV